MKPSETSKDHRHILRLRNYKPSSFQITLPARFLERLGWKDERWLLVLQKESHLEIHHSPFPQDLAIIEEEKASKSPSPSTNATAYIAGGR